MSLNLQDAARGVPGGRWAVGVSGGADSVALLKLLRDQRPDLGLWVVHLNHQTRGAESDGDAAFVAELCGRWGMGVTVAKLDDIRPAVEESPNNPSALYRACRLGLFRQVIAERGLDGVILAHHADDQAETVLHRLLRGSGPAGLGGMARETRVQGVRIVRPLMATPGRELREYLAATGQDWREDASNQTERYARNRLRRVLRKWPEIGQKLLELGAACAELREWLRGHAPVLAEEFMVRELWGSPAVLAEEAARQWLVARGAAMEDLTSEVVRRLVEMATDAASPARRHFPGGVLVRRRSGKVSVEDKKKSG